MALIDNILFPVDFSPSCVDMAPYVKRAAALFDARVSLVYVFDLMSHNGFELYVRPLPEIEEEHQNIALNAPAWQAIVPELVPLDEVPAAVALNSVGFNVARAAGPAVGGLIVASAGPSAVFFLNSASFVAVMVVLYRWPRPARESTLPAERIWGAVRAGIRYARYAPVLQRVLVRAFLFTFFASAVWALMPLVAKINLGRGAASYGLLLGFMGAGAVLGGSILPRSQQAVSTDRLLAAALVLFAFGLFLLGFSHRLVLACMATAAAGIAWTSLLSTLNAIVQVKRQGGCAAAPYLSISSACSAVLLWEA